MSVAKEALHSPVEALRALLETAGPQAEAFLRDWPQELIARPVGARSLPVVAALQGLSRLAAPETRALVEAVEALAARSRLAADLYKRRFRRAVP